MGLINRLCINKSGQDYLLYEGSTNTYKGKIYNREAFAYIGAEGNNDYIGFLNSNGNLQTLVVNNYLHPIPQGFFTPCTNYPYSTEYINGVKYYIFKMRQTKNVYTADGNYWGQVAAGMYVATDSSYVGETHFDWKLIRYVKSTAGQWVKVDGNGSDYGFVNTGLSSSSLPSGIAMYGSW